MKIRFREREEIDEAMPEILRDTKPCLKFISEEENELPIYTPLPPYDDSDSPVSLGTMNVKFIPLHFKPMISTGDWVPILQFKLIISDINFDGEKHRELFKLFLPNRVEKITYSHFMISIRQKIDEYLRYCNMRNFSYNIYEIEWKDL